MKAETISQSREYLTVLLRRRSVIALCCGILTLALAFYGIIAGVGKSIARYHETGFHSFIYYTMISNVLAALSIAITFPYAVEGIRKKRFTVPKWVALLHYVAATTITVTMAVASAFISWVSPEDAFGGSNIVTHVFCPLLILLSFFQMENGHLFSWKDRLIGVVPLCLYMIVYFVEVVVIGEANGGWPDIYRIMEFVSPAAALALSPLFAFAVSTVVALISNALTKRRTAKMFRFWKEDLDPIEVRFEAYGMGCMAGRYGEKNNLDIPYDILLFLADRYHLKTEDLLKPFVKGLLVGLKDRDQGL